MMSFVYTLVFLKEKPAHTPRHAMDNNIMNHTNYNNKLITNNSSWDLEIPMSTAMEDNHFMNPHLHHHQIPNHNHHTTPLFPNYPPQYSSQSSCVDLPSNSALFLTTTTGLSEVHAEDNELVEEDNKEDLGAMKEMMYKIAAMQPVDIDPATIRRSRRRNVRISNDPQSVAARLRRERISERIRILQRLVPGGTKMDTASMLDEAIRYVKFLKRQIRLLQSNNNFSNNHHQLSSPHCAQEENNIINWGFGTSLPNKLGHGYIGNSYNTTSGSASGSWFTFAGGGCSSSFDKA